MIVNKGVIIGIIVAIVIVVGAVALAQDNESGTTEVTDIESGTTEVIDIENNQREPQSFSVDLTESVGVTEEP